jgi:CubicO group peptidase (beta-lactamase class C family)
MRPRFKADGPGAAALVMKEGRVVFRQAYGLASLELGVPLTPDAVFHVGSIGKQFTAAAVMSLVEEGKVDRKAPIGRYLAEAPPHWAKVTVEHLLTNTSGIPHPFNDSAFRAREREDMTPAQLLAVSAAKPLDFEPGTDWAYSNAGFCALGLLVERVSGKPYDAFVQARFFAPLGMKHTFYERGGQVIPGRASGYDDGPRVPPFVSPTLGFAAGSFFSTVEDLATWTTALHEGKILGPKALQAMQTPFTLKDGTDTHYGMGLDIHRLQGQPWVHHTGDVPGYHTELAALPESKVVVVVLYNGVIDLSPGYFAARLAAMAIEKPLEAPRSVVIHEAALKALEGRYTYRGTIRTIRVLNGALTSQVGNGDASPMVALSPTEFTFADSDLKLSFVLKGDRATALRRTSYDHGPDQVYLRTGDL